MRTGGNAKLESTVFTAFTAFTVEVVDVLEGVSISDGVHDGISIKLGVVIADNEGLSVIEGVHDGILFKLGVAITGGDISNIEGATEGAGVDCNESEIERTDS